MEVMVEKFLNWLTLTYPGIHLEAWELAFLQIFFNKYDGVALVELPADRKTALKELIAEFSEYCMSPKN